MKNTEIIEEFLTRNNITEEIHTISIWYKQGVAKKDLNLKNKIIIKIWVRFDEGFQLTEVAFYKKKN